MPQMNMDHAVDPAKALKEEIGDLTNFDVTYSNILVGIYKRPDKTKSGILLPDQTREEDKYQGKVALVLKKGPMAFKDTDNISFNGFEVNEGDWVVLRASDGWPLQIRKTDCRMISDTTIKMVVKNPDDVW